jgi:hypothetical protein
VFVSTDDPQIVRRHRGEGQHADLLVLDISADGQPDDPEEPQDGSGIEHR